MVWISIRLLIMTSVLDTLLTALLFCGATANICTENNEGKTRREFAYNVYAEARKQTASDQNIFIAPTTVASTLSMVLMGAKGSTKSQISDVIFPNSTENLSGDDIACLKILYDLNTRSTTKATTPLVIRTSSRLFGEKSYIFSEKFRDNTALFGASMEEVEFLSSPDPIRKYINRLVSRDTGDTIKDFFDEGAIGSDTVLAMVSAIFFKGLWKSPFDPVSTKRRDFQLELEQFVELDFMSRNGRYMYYFSDKMNADMLELPYQESERYNISMIILLPYGSMDTTEKKMNDENLSTEIENLLNGFESMAEVSIPKLNISTELDLLPILAGMGMTDLQTSGVADLSGMLGDSNKYDVPLTIKTAIHKTFLEVTEEGTTAAGATGFGVVPLSLPPRFICDRPFITIFYEKKTDSILFIGKIMNPTAEIL